MCIRVGPEDIKLDTILNTMSSKQPTNKTPAPDLVKLTSSEEVYFYAYPVVKGARKIRYHFPGTLLSLPNLTMFWKSSAVYLGKLASRLFSLSV